MKRLPAFLESQLPSELRLFREFYFNYENKEGGVNDERDETLS